MNYTQTKSISYLMWLIPLSFFTYQFILRLFPSLIMQQLLLKFTIDATSFGLLASVYYYGYAGFQIPLAILLDKYKPKYVIFISAGVCGVATLIFSITEDWYLLLFSRFLIGAGSAVAFLGVSKIVSLWFSSDSYAKIIGFSFTIGLCGGILGGRPINILIEQIGWELVSYVLAGAAFLISILILLFLKDKVNEKSKSASQFNLKDINNLIKTPIIWLLALSNLLMVGSLEGFADVWGLNYLIEAYNMSKSEAAQLTSFIFVGMLFGGPILALCAKYYSNYTVLVTCGLLMSGIFYILLIYKNSLNYQLIAALFWLLGVVCCYQVIIFASAASTISDKKLLGITIAFLNSANMLGGSFFHSIIGLMMDRVWSGVLIDGIRQYDLESYKLSLMTIPICALIGSMLILVIKLKVNKATLP